MSNKVKIAKIRLTATVTDTDGGSVDGWLNIPFSGAFEVYDGKDQADVIIVELEDGFGSAADNEDAIEAAIVDAIGAIDSFDGETAYAADVEVGRVHGQTSRLAAHVELVEEAPYRRAIIVTRTSNDLKSVPAYLPGNYKVVGSAKEFDTFGSVGLVIEGKDDAGWTLDEYVLPRLASGLHFGRELEDGELSRWIDEGKYAPIAGEQTEMFEVVQELEYDIATDTLTEVN